MNLGEKAVVTATIIAVVVFGIAYILARSRASKRGESAVVNFTVSREGVTDLSGERIAPSYLMTEEEYRVTSAASGYGISSITLDVNGERLLNRYIDERAFETDLAHLIGAQNVPALDLHVGFQPDGQRALYVWLSQEWSPLLLGQRERMDDEGRDIVAELLRSQLPDDGSVKYPANRLGRLVGAMEKAYTPEIEGSETLRNELGQLRVLLNMAGEGELFLTNKAGMLAVLSRIGARSFHRRAEDGLTEVNLT